jgi:flagellar biogenesis protein FliO
MDWIRQVLAIATVGILLAASLAWLRRRGLWRPAGNGTWRRRPRQLELVDRLSLTSQHSLHLVRLGERAILVGRSPSGITLLSSSKWSPQEDIAP